jgi:hypothetical protein
MTQDRSTTGPNSPMMGKICSNCKSFGISVNSEYAGKFKENQ